MEKQIRFLGFKSTHTSVIIFKGGEYHWLTKKTAEIVCGHTWETDTVTYKRIVIQVFH